MKKDVITFRLTPEKKKALDAIAASMDRDRAYILNEAVEDYIELHQWQLSHIQNGLEQASKGEFASDEDVQKAFRKWTK
jgi:predicted transcriptional regulator